MSGDPKSQGYEDVALYAVQIEHGAQGLQPSDVKGSQFITGDRGSAETSAPGRVDSNLLRLAVEGIDQGKRGREFLPVHLDAPAIIIHSAISTPGDDERSSFNDMSPQDDERTNDGSQNNEVVKDPLNYEQETNRFDSTRGIGSNKNDCNVDFSSPNFDNCEDAASSVKHLCEFRRTSPERETIFNASTSLGEANDVSFKAQTSQVPRISKDTTSMHSVQSNDSSDKKSPCRYLMKNEGKSSSLDDQWSESSSTDRLIGDAKPRSRDASHYGNSSHKASRQIPSKNGQLFDMGMPSSSLMPSTSKMSKSYNDLSGRHRPGNDAGGDSSFLQDLHSSGRNRAMLEVCGGTYKQHNKSGSNLDKIGDHAHSSKNHLLPETRTFHGSHNMRSVSADDVRMRSGTDEYVWKDGKVQLKNGVVSHGESVRYVWKDGHVEKITTDANNEETQVEILETSDDKACNKINPVFICVVLIAFIAVAIILPIYFTS